MNNKFTTSVLLSCIFIFAACLSQLSLAQTTNTPTQVVYHVDDAEAQGLKALRNIRNHLDTAPSTKIIMVTHANGVDILMDGAKDKKIMLTMPP